MGIQLNCLHHDLLGEVVHHYFVHDHVVALKEVEYFTVRDLLLQHPALEGQVLVRAAVAHTQAIKLPLRAHVIRLPGALHAALLDELVQVNRRREFVLQPLVESSPRNWRRAQGLPCHNLLSRLTSPQP